MNNALASAPDGQHADPIVPAATWGEKQHAQGRPGVGGTAGVHFALGVCAASAVALVDWLAVAYAGIPRYALVVIAAVVAALWFGSRSRRTSAAAAALVRQADVRTAESVALLAHELRNPVAALCSGLDLVRQTLDPETVCSTAVRMERQLSHVTRLIEDLLDTARLDGGKAKLQLRTRSVDSLVSDSIALASTFTGAKRQHVVAALDVDVGSVDVDPARVMQVLGNLLHNASKFSPPDSTITVRASRTSSFVSIAVRDAGIGIAPDQLERIFGRYAQVEAGAHSGLGLGLSLVRQLMELHGGSVVARSMGPGAGSEFVLTFRRTPPPGLAPCEPPARRPALLQERSLVARTIDLIRQPASQQREV